VKKLKVAELKELLSARGLITNGKKDELVARLELSEKERAGAAGPAAADDDVPPAQEQPEAPGAPSPAEPSQAPAPAAKPPAAKDDFEAKKAERAARFGIAVVQTKKDVTLADEEKIKERAKRFGVISKAAAALDPAEAERLRKRKERFGDISKQNAPVDPEEEERRKKRAERFKTSS